MKREPPCGFIERSRTARHRCADNRVRERSVTLRKEGQGDTADTVGAARQVYWREKIKEALGDRVADRNYRYEFALILLHQLAFSIPWGRHQHNRLLNVPRLKQMAAVARDAVFALRQQILRDPDAYLIHQRTDTATGEGLEIDRIAAFLEKFARDAEASAESLPRRRQGRRDTVPVAIARTIALVYCERLGEWPSCGWEGVTESPFDRVCTEVEGFLAECGYRTRSKTGHAPIKISRPARRKGIAQAKQKPIEVGMWIPVGDEDDWLGAAQALTAARRLEGN